METNEELKYILAFMSKSLGFADPDYILHSQNNSTGETIWQRLMFLANRNGSYLTAKQAILSLCMICYRININNNNNNTNNNLFLHEIIESGFLDILLESSTGMINLLDLIIKTLNSIIDGLQSDEDIYNVINAIVEHDELIHLIQAKAPKKPLNTYDENDPQIDAFILLCKCGF